MSAPRAIRACARSQVTAACSARLRPCHVRRFKHETLTAVRRRSRLHLRSDPAKHREASRAAAGRSRPPRRCRGRARSNCCRALLRRHAGRYRSTHRNWSPGAAEGRHPLAHHAGLPRSGDMGLLARPPLPPFTRTTDRRHNRCRVARTWSDRGAWLPGHADDLWRRDAASRRHCMEYRCTAAVSKRRTSLEYCDVRPNQRMQQPRARFALAAATP